VIRESPLGVYGKRSTHSQMIIFDLHPSSAYVKKYKSGDIRK
jgi:hypothetical protein